MHRLKLKPLAHQTIVITGASSGIGLATAKMAASRGAMVVLVSRSPEVMEQICEEIRSQGGRADFVEADVGNHDEVKRVVGTVVERQGGFDTWVNDAGVGLYSRLEEVSDADHEQLFRTNYWGVVWGSIEAVKHLRERGGALINIGSVLSDMGAPVLSAYAATKHAVKGFTDSLRLELMRENAPVSLSLIKPSSVQSHFPDNARSYLEGAAKLPPPVYHPDVVAGAILHAAEHPRREFTVGGAGRLMTLAAGLFPHVTDRVYSQAFSRLTEGRDSPRQEHGSALHQAAGRGEIMSRGAGHVRRHSLYTAIQTHPKLALGLSALAGIVVAGAMGQKYRNSHLPFHRRVLREIRQPLAQLGLLSMHRPHLRKPDLEAFRKSHFHKPDFDGLNIPRPHLSRHNLPHSPHLGKYVGKHLNRADLPDMPHMRDLRGRAHMPKMPKRNGGLRSWL